ncbi:MAG: LON peptidase substrate-binding domain-containing protein [Gemmatimonadetes bacterium]|nr:LON peptidase substrate-binding domain-containing protein [Gemmatimonadota bacterium]
MKSTVIFPTGATGLQVGFPPNVEVLGLQPGKSFVVGLVTTDDEDLPIDPTALEKVGVLARVLNRLNLPGGLVQATIQGIIRIQLEGIRFENGYYTGFPKLVEETAVEPEEADRLIEKILTTLGGIGAKIERLADVPRVLRQNIGDPGRFADLVATLAHFSVAEKDEVLQRLAVRERLLCVLRVLEAEWEHLRDRGETESEGQGERAPGRSADRTSDIRKQISALQAELGEVDPSEREALEMLRLIDRSQLPASVASVARREAERMRTTPPSSPDAGEIRSYVEAVVELPWERMSDGGTIDLEAVARALDEHHPGAPDLKRRILEILSVATLRGSLADLVPCIVGPPGVGKARLAAAIAQGLGRPLARVELGGRGEAQLAGGRRARPGAQPGKLISAFRDAEVRDPVYLLEEIDEVGLGNVEGDPAEVVEEFLDPANRAKFIDRYFDIPFDLTDAVFVASATDFMRIPRGIRDQLIEIRLAGYTPEEKVDIASRRLLPELIVEHGLEPGDLELDGDALVYLTRGYARDAGLGLLRRGLSSILRYIAHQKATGGRRPWKLSRGMIEEVLGIPRYPTTEAESSPEVGVVTGLAWTASGGELMFIEALKMPGSGRLIITGLLGEVMRESVSAAYSYVRSRATPLGIPAAAFGENDLHIHFPAGATPKDGPSAGAAVTLAIASSLSDRSVRHDVAMTGEVTLRGRIMEIGGVKEKILAAYRAGLRKVILPSGNERDLRDVPDDVRTGMTFHFVNRMDEVLDIALLPKKRPRRKTAERPSAAHPPTRQAARGKGDSDG